MDGYCLDFTKSIAKFISPQLTYIFNLSFSLEIFPKILKNAIVITIQKSGSYSHPHNYRPIFILIIFTKLLEKLFYNHLIPFVENNDIIHTNQFNFTKNTFTTVTIAHVISHSPSKFNNKNKVAFIC